MELYRLIIFLTKLPKVELHT